MLLTNISASFREVNKNFFFEAGTEYVSLAATEFVKSQGSVDLFSILRHQAS